MKKLLLLLSVLGALLAPSSASAFTYKDGDLLLVFYQDGFNDVEFNLGTVSNYLGKASGTIITVTNWNKTLVENNYFGSLYGSKFLLVACTGQILPVNTRRAWLSHGDESATPTDVAQSRLNNQIAKITDIGNRATNANNGTTNSFAVVNTDPNSYSELTSLDPATLGSESLFSVAQDFPGTVRFFLMRPNPAPQPNATQIGSFTLGEDGTLTFTAGGGTLPAPPVPVITKVQRSGQTTTISFTTTNTVNYRLRYSDTVGPAKTSWTTAAGTVTGNGSVMTLQDTSASSRFYAVEAYR